MFRVTETNPVNLVAIAHRMDWDGRGNELISGNLDSEHPDVAAMIRELARGQEVEDAAKAMGIGPIQLSIALIADSIAAENRHAARVRRRLLHGIDSSMFEAFAREFGLRFDEEIEDPC